MYSSTEKVTARAARAWQGEEGGRGWRLCVRRSLGTLLSTA